MKRILVLFIMAIAGVLLAETQTDVKGKNMDAILLVTFGTSDQEARKAFANIERLAKVKFPGYEIRWAYTSEIIRKKMAKRGEFLLSTSEALAKLKEDGFKNVYAQSLHIIPGEEFHQVAIEATEFKKDFVKLAISPPLLNYMDDVKESVKIMLSKTPPDRKKEDAVIFMGHGSEKHPSDMIYVATAYVIEKNDSNAFIATVDGNPKFDEVLEKLKVMKVKKAYIVPFMSVAGDHAKNDMAGDEPDSWKSILSKNGIESVPVMKGMAEYDEIVNIWLEHLAQSVK